MAPINKEQVAPVLIYLHLIHIEGKIFVQERYEVVQILENQKHPNHICKCQQNGSGHGKDGLWLPTTRESTMMEIPQDSETTR